MQIPFPNIPFWTTKNLSRAVSEFWTENMNRRKEFNGKWVRFVFQLQWSFDMKQQSLIKFLIYSKKYFWFCRHFLSKVFFLWMLFMWFSFINVSATMWILIASSWGNKQAYSLMTQIWNCIGLILSTFRNVSFKDSCALDFVYF